MNQNKDCCIYHRTSGYTTQSCGGDIFVPESPTAPFTPREV